MEFSGVEEELAILNEKKATFEHYDDKIKKMLSKGTDGKKFERVRDDGHKLPPVTHQNIS